MAEETKLEEGKNAPETTEIEIGGKKYDPKKLGAILENQPKFEAEYHESRRQLREVQDELKALREAQKPKEEAPAGKKLSQIPLDSEEFIPTLVRTIETVDERITRLMALDEKRVSDDMRKIANSNRNLLDTFSMENELSSEEKDQVMKLAIKSDHNDIRYEGRTAVISPLALEDALIIVRKDRIIARSKQDGREQTIQEIFGKTQVEARAGETKSGEEPDSKWLADNWQKLTEEQRQKYRNQLFPGSK